MGEERTIQDAFTLPECHIAVLAIDGSLVWIDGHDR